MTPTFAVTVTVPDTVTCVNMTVRVPDPRADPADTIFVPGATKYALFDCAELNTILGSDAATSALEPSENVTLIVSCTDVGTPTREDGSDADVICTGDGETEMPTGATNITFERTYVV